MTKYYKSNYYKNPIEVDNIDGEIIVNIITDLGEKIIYTWYDFIDKTSYSPYIKNAVLGSFVGDLPENILIIGFGGGAYAKYFKDYLGNKINITGIEIDEAMIEIAKKEFKLNDINYFNLDYIESLNILNKKKNIKFDIIFIDIYDNNSKIPDSLNNEETIRLITNLLSNNGKIITNYANFRQNEIFYKDIENKILNCLKNKKKLEILNGENNDGNIIGIYNLKNKYNSESLILDYLQKVQNGSINYDSNLISKIYLK